MVQPTSRAQHCSGTAERTIFLCRGTRSCVRSTAVRCFKGGPDGIGNKPNTNLRLSFKIPYRVNFGQSLGLVGSGDSLGNWDPKRTVQMKWTDGDWWTVELSVTPGGSLDLEYKYVVVNSDGNIGYWKPGSNYRVTLPLQPRGTKVPKRVKVADAWDDSFKKVDIEEAEVQGGAPSSNGTGATSKVPQSASQTEGGVARQQVQRQLAPGTPDAVPTPSSVRSVPPAAAEARASSNGATPQMPTPVAAPAALQTAAPSVPQAAVPPVPKEAPPPAAQKAATAVASQVPMAGATQAAAPSQTSGTLTPTAGPVTPRATSPRSIPPTFAAATTIPVIHPSLLAEQERLEDGVRNSLEDLQAQMDKHQQLRERIDDPAAVEILVADRIVAAANNRVVAYNKALKAVQEYNRLPPSASAPKDAASGVEK